MDFISDEDMKKLEAGGSLPDSLSDEEMAQLEQASPQMKNSDYLRTTKGKINEWSAERASPENVGAAANNALSAMTGGLAGAGKNWATRAVGDGAIGAAQSPDSRLKGFLTGAALRGTGDALSGTLGKIGDVSMQAAVGRRKYTPGVGTTLADEGLIGTSGMLKDQVASKMTKRAQDMQRIATGIDGKPISGRKIAQEVSDEFTGPMTGRGTVKVSDADMPDFHAARTFTTDIAARGNETVADALARRSASGNRAYRGKENPANSITGKLSKLEQQKYSQAIKAADPTGRMAEADKAYSALARARKGLDEEATIPKSLMGLAGTTVTNVPGGSLVTSGIGQAATKSSKLAEWLAPLLRQSALNDPKDKK
jgi:hypothetical protein